MLHLELETTLFIIMNKTILDKRYETPAIINKALLYIIYLLRVTYWRLLNLIFENKTKTREDFRLDNSFCEEFKTNGVLHLKKVFTDDCIEKIVSSVQLSREILEKGRESRGLKSGRIANLHATNREIFNFLNDPVLKQILKKLLSSEPVLWGSLAFNKGSQQPLHSDAPFFYVEPFGSMVGMWIALEDISPDAGPLCYVPQSHNKVLSVESVISTNENLKQKVNAFRELNVSASPRKYWDLSFEVSEEYSKVRQQLAGAVEVCPKKGDVFFWHQWLVHGGSKINNETLSRNSIVSHWVGKDAIPFDQHNFFLNYGKLNEKFKQKLPVNRIRNCLHVRQLRSQVLGWD